MVRQFRGVARNFCKSARACASCPLALSAAISTNQGSSAIRSLSEGNSAIASRACSIASGKRSFASNPVARFAVDGFDRVGSLGNELPRGHEVFQRLLGVPLNEQDEAELAMSHGLIAG